MAHVDIYFDSSLTENDILGTMLRLSAHSAVRLEADAVVLVTAQISIWKELTGRQSEWSAGGVKSIKVIVDAQAPAPIAWSTYAGHRYAREFGESDISTALPFRREVVALID